MKREAPLLSNKVKKFSEFVHLTVYICMFSVWMMIATDNRTLFTITESGVMVSKYRLLSPLVVLAITFLLWVLLIGSFIITFYVKKSYLELYPEKLYLLPVEPLKWKRLKSHFFSNFEDQPEIFSYREIESIGLGKIRRVNVYLKNGTMYTCYAEAKFAEEIIIAFKRKRRRG